MIYKTVVNETWLFMSQSEYNMHLLLIFMVGCAFTYLIFYMFITINEKKQKKEQYKKTLSDREYRNYTDFLDTY